MTGFNIDEWVARPPQDVFDFIAASENAPKIAQSVKSMVKLTDGPVRIGTRYHEIRVVNGKEQQAELEIVEFEPPRKYSMRNVTEGVETVYRYNFQPERDGTRIDLVCEVRAKGIKKLILPMLVSFLKKEDGDHLQKLKKVLEE